jgi:hypothetical protein
MASELLLHLAPRLQVCDTLDRSTDSSSTRPRYLYATTLAYYSCAGKVQSWSRNASSPTLAPIRNVSSPRLGCLLARHCVRRLLFIDRVLIPLRGPWKH